jgi:uncharacterized protein YdgA (DUF945 family)
MNKTLPGIAAAVALSVIAWAGSGVYIGIRADNTLRSMALQTGTGATAPWRISDVQHQRGLFHSSGDLVATYSPGCANLPNKDDRFTVKLSYTLTHLPLPNAAARFQWQLSPQGDTAEAFKTLFGSASALGGQGSVSLTGAVRTDMSLPAVALRRSGEVLTITPSSGTLRMSGQQLAMQWKIDRVVIRGRGQAFDMENMALDLDIDNRSKGTGSGSLKVAKSSTSQGSLEGLELSFEAREKGDRLHMNVTPSLRKLEVAGQVLTDLRMQWALNGLHTDSSERLIKLFEDNCGMQALTAQESQIATQALQTLLVKGFTFGMSSLTGKGANGSLEGSWIVELAAASGNTPSLAEQLRSSGTIEINGSVITPQQREMAVATGFAVAQGDKLSASYEYTRGLFKLNGHAMDATPLEGILMRADESLRSALAGAGSNSSPASPRMWP